MTVARSAKTVCVACGAESQQPELTSTSLLGTPDLDLRPSELARSTLPLWVQECPHCGYVGERISAAPYGGGIWPHVLLSADWQELATDWRGPPLASRFLRLRLLEDAADRPHEAAKASLCAAWIADDAGDRSLAIACRKTSARRFDMALSIATDDEDAQQWMRVRLIDVLRRAEEWDAAALRCAAFLEIMPEGNARTILRFQTDLIGKRAAACFTVADALTANGGTQRQWIRVERPPKAQTSLRATGRWQTSQPPNGWLSRLWVSSRRTSSQRRSR